MLNTVEFEAKLLDLFKDSLLTYTTVVFERSTRYRRLKGICRCIDDHICLNNNSLGLDLDQIYKVFKFIRNSTFIGLCTCPRFREYLINVYGNNYNKECCIHKHSIGLQYYEDTQRYHLNFTIFTEAIKYYSQFV